MGEEDLSIAEILYQNFVTDGPQTGKETRSELGALGVLVGEEHILSIVPDPGSNLGPSIRIQESQKLPPNIKKFDALSILGY